MNVSSFDDRQNYATDKEGDNNMDNKERIETLNEQIEAYKQAIEDAENALAAVEQELEELLADMYEMEQNQ